MLHEDAFPFRPYRFERDGAIYNKIGIKKWQNSVPDMSKILPDRIPAKKLTGDLCKRVPVMIKETCVAELIHIVLCVLSLFCLAIWRGTGGIIVTALYILGNLPFILIQRYNRPRFVRLLNQRRKLPPAVNMKYQEESVRIQ